MMRLGPDSLVNILHATKTERASPLQSLCPRRLYGLMCCIVKVCAQVTHSSSLITSPLISTFPSGQRAWNCLSRISPESRSPLFSRT